LQEEEEEKEGPALELESLDKIDLQQQQQELGRALIVLKFEFIVSSALKLLEEGLKLAGLLEIKLLFCVV